MSRRKEEQKHGHVILGAWSIWNHRNRCVFDGITPSLPCVIATIQERYINGRSLELEGFLTSSPWQPLPLRRFGSCVLFGLVYFLLIKTCFCIRVGCRPLILVHSRFLFPFFLLNILMCSSPAHSRKKSLIVHGYISQVLWKASKNACMPMLLFLNMQHHTQKN